MAAREDGASPSRCRRCDRGRKPLLPLSEVGWEGAAERTIREPEDLPEAVRMYLPEVGSSREHGSREGRLHVARPLEGAM